MEQAIAGAKDILAERISDEADYRIRIRDLTTKKGTISSVAKDPEAESVYEMYYEFEEPIKKLAGHRILALNRGEKEKFLTVKVNAPEEEILRYLEHQVITKENPVTAPVLKEVVDDCYKRLIAPAIEREIHTMFPIRQKMAPLRYLERIWSSFLCSLPLQGRLCLDGIRHSVPDVSWQW